MNLLICMVTGILSNTSVQLPEIASGVEKHVKSESKIKQFKRFLMNKYTDQASFYLPFVQPLLEKLTAIGELVFAIDSSTCGNECMVLMVSVIYKKRAIPIIYMVIQKGGKRSFAGESTLPTDRKTHHYSAQKLS